jgi:hypothetical protein
MCVAVSLWKLLKKTTIRKHRNPTGCLGEEPLALDEQVPLYTPDVQVVLQYNYKN